LRLQELVETSAAVAATGGRLAKIDRLAGLLRRLDPREAEAAVAWLCGELAQGRIGIGPSALRDATPATAAPDPALDVSDVEAAFGAMRRLRGAGSASERAALLRGLLTRATRAEQDFIARLLMGELRQGALEGVVAEAVARAAALPADSIRRAVMVAGDLPGVAAAVLARGAEALGGFAPRLFQPLQPMLAQPAESVRDALGRLPPGPAAFEYKLDGARIQVHKSGGDVRIFTRALNDVGAAVPEIVAAARALPPAELILDGEAIAIRADGRPHRFQDTMRRFGRTLDEPSLREQLPLSAYFFDCLFLEGAAIIERPAAERFEALAQSVPEALRVPRLVTAALPEAEAFLGRALDAGHEGVMAKSLEAAYEAGARGTAWLKVKQVRTLDLVVLAAEWGHGRRRGWLSNLHLGARDPATGGFVMLGKTFKGMTDEILAWQTARLREIEADRVPGTVFVRPELVAEIAFNDIQASPRYPGGLALRFARLRRYRPDKRPEDADTIDTVRAIHARS
jgi:DNA ligase-1